jgi:outer membrane protein assembly factor BamC
MNIKTGRLLIIATALFNLSACGYIKSLFPDKEKDYQYTTEIPPLIWPNDLRHNSTPAHPAATIAPPVAASAPAASSENEPAIPDTAIKVEQVKADDGASHLRVNVPFIQAWRMVGKALNRKSIEVTERNQDARQFTIEYDPGEHAQAEDGSIWDEVTFMFGGIQGNEKTYRLKLTETHQQTDIVVVDEDQKPLADADSVKLLNLLETTLKADLTAK